MVNSKGLADFQQAIYTFSSKRERPGSFFLALLLPERVGVNGQSPDVKDDLMYRKSVHDRPQAYEPVGVLLLRGEPCVGVDRRDLTRGDHTHSVPPVLREVHRPICSTT